MRSRLVRFAGYGALGPTTELAFTADQAIQVDHAWRLALVPEKGEHRSGTRGS